MNVQKLYENSESTIGSSSDDHKRERWIVVFNNSLSACLCYFHSLLYILSSFLHKLGMNVP